MVVKTPDNLCVMCGSVIPEGKQYCPSLKYHARMTYSYSRRQTVLSDLRSI